MVRSLLSATAILLMGSVAFAQPGPGPGGGRGMQMRHGQGRVANMNATLTTTMPAAPEDLVSAAPLVGRRRWRWQAEDGAQAGGGPRCPGCRCGAGPVRKGAPANPAATQPAAGRQRRVDCPYAQNARTSGRQSGAARQGMLAVEHEAIWTLLDHHDSIKRSIEEIPDGVSTTTTTSRPELVGALRTHVRQMARRLESGQSVRMWDPVFRDVFQHAREIKMEIKEIDGGVLVTETSANPAVVPMIRAHAQKVAQFAEQGYAAARPPWAGER